MAKLRASFGVRTGIAALVAAMIGGTALAADGKAIYADVCQACHQAGGKGAPGVAPPLVSSHIKSMASKAPNYVPLVALNGLSGAIEVAGISYHLVMPPQAALDDADIAAVANYIYGTLNGQRAVRFTAQQIAALRDTPKTAAQLRALRGGQP